MRILIHDYAGHPFQADLSRSLAARGHQVTHAWFAADTGPKGRLQRIASDPKGLEFAPLGAQIAYSKTNFLLRRRGDIAYGKSLARQVRQTCPELVYRAIPRPRPKTRWFQPAPAAAAALSIGARTFTRLPPAGSWRASCRCWGL